jgi:hypothetical protein
MVSFRVVRLLDTRPIDARPSGAIPVSGSLEQMIGRSVVFSPARQGKPLERISKFLG